MVPLCIYTKLPPLLQTQLFHLCHPHSVANQRCMSLHIVACSQDLLILALYERAWCWSMSFRSGQFEVPILAFLFGLWRLCLHYEAISIRTDLHTHEFGSSLC